MFARIDLETGESSEGINVIWPIPKKVRKESSSLAFEMTVNIQKNIFSL